MPATLGIEQEIMALVTRLSPEQKHRILGFVEGMVAQSKPKGTPPAAFAHLRGTLSRAAAEEMKAIIEDDCERIDHESW